ncbi:MAG: hypothetical protein P4N41_10085 [Negativicutes bacterium]|nr:hypothetical protein [Negativicutes bacterium]
MTKIIRQRFEPGGYGPDNPEPQEFKDSALVRNESRNALHAAIEYVNAGASSDDDDDGLSLSDKDSPPT